MSVINLSLQSLPTKSSSVDALYDSICTWIAVNDYAELSPEESYVVSPRAPGSDLCLGTTKKELCQSPCVWKERNYTQLVKSGRCVTSKKTKETVGAGFFYDKHVSTYLGDITFVGCFAIDYEDISGEYALKVFLRGETLVFLFPWASLDEYSVNGSSFHPDSGFIYEEGVPSLHTMAPVYADIVLDVYEQLKERDIFHSKIIFCGHSLGCALSQSVALLLYKNIKKSTFPVRLLSVVGSACGSVMDEKTCSFFEKVFAGKFALFALRMKLKDRNGKDVIYMDKHVDDRTDYESAGRIPTIFIGYSKPVVAVSIERPLRTVPATYREEMEMHEWRDYYFNELRQFTLQPEECKIFLKNYIDM